MAFIRGKQDKNQTFTMAGLAAGAKLQEMFDAGATEDKIKTAKYGQDSGGRWFAQIGTREATLDTDSALGKANTVVTVPEIVAVPIPLQLREDSLVIRG